MKFPNAVTILRSSTPDTYGNPHADWTAPATSTAVGMFLAPSSLFLPATTDVRPRDRVAVAGELFTVDSVGKPGPGHAVVLALVLTRLPDGA